MNYESMSDFEINKAVAEIDEKFKSCIDAEFFMSDSSEGAVDVVSQGVLICTVNYCTDVNFAWSIMIENEIGINKLKCEPLWIADKGGDYVRNKNPLRAAMIVFLMMQNG
jgi:hypothetical protein